MGLLRSFLRGRKRFSFESLESRETFSAAHIVAEMILPDTPGNGRRICDAP